MSQWDGFGEAMVGFMYLAVVGMLAIVGGSIYGLYWLWCHVSLVVK